MAAATTDAATLAPPRRASPQNGLVGLVVALAVILFKFKAVAFAVLFKLKSLLVVLKFGKILTTASTMVLSIGVYSSMWGWKFATGFVFLTLIHELGHVLVAWQKKLPVTAPMFIPFMGAFIGLKARLPDALTEAHIGYGGPALGALGDAVAAGIYFITGNPLFLAFASFSMMVNLFNLIPVSPLDGGRIVTAISPWIWIAGLVMMGGWYLYTHSPLTLIILVVGGLRLATSWKALHTDEYFKVAPRQRAIMTLLYIGLILLLGGMHSYSHNILMEWIRLNAPQSAPGSVGLS